MLSIVPVIYIQDPASFITVTIFLVNVSDNIGLDQ